jgi:hypothetical protein
MKNSLVRCTAILSAVSLSAFGQPVRAYQTSDSYLRQELQESDSYSRTKVIVKAFQVCFTTSFFDDKFISFVDCQQDKNLNKISKKINTNIGLITEREFDLLCQLVAAEAENQPFEGKCAVVGVVLNRVEYGWPFEEEIEAVIFQDGAFSCIDDGRFFEAWEYVSDEDREAVIVELTDRNYPDYLFFTAGHYGQYGTPAEQIGDHYFCTE